MVWRASTQLGCGIATYSYQSEGYTWYATYIVAQYKPRGNFYYIGHKQEAYNDNVKPLKPGGTDLALL